MRQDIKNFSECYASKEDVAILKQEFENIKGAPTINYNSRKVIPKRGAFTLDSFEYNSGPMGLHPLSYEKDLNASHCSFSPQTKNRCQHQQNEGRSKNKSTDVLQMLNGASVTYVTESAVSEPVEVRKIRQPVASERMTHASTGATSPSVLTAVPVHSDRKPQERKSYTQVLEQGKWKPQEENEQWKLVQKKRLKNRFVGNKGKAIVESHINFKAADIRIPLYVYNIAKDVTEADVQNYIKNKTEVSVELEKMIMKTPKEYDAYKVYGM
jgi:hypothetical protein